MACIILLEDDSDLRSLYAQAMRIAGHEVHEADSSRGIMALLRLRAEKGGKP